MGLQGLRVSVNKPKPAFSIAPGVPSRRGSAAAPCAHAHERPTGAAPRRLRSACLTMIQNRPMLTKAYRIFGLRQGTMMIAMHDLMWSTCLVFLMVLAAAHVREVSHMVEADMMNRLAAAHRADHGRSHAEHLGAQPAQPAQLGRGNPDSEQLQFNEHAALEQLAKEHLARGGSANGILLSPPSALELERRERARPQHQGEGREDRVVGALAPSDAANLTRPELEGPRKAGRKCGGNSSSSYMHYVEYAYSQAKSIINLDINESRLNDGVHFATMPAVLSVVMVIGICAAGIDMIASIMLLAGAMLNVRQLMMPWLSLRLLELIVLLGFAFISMVFLAQGFVFCRILFLDLLIFCEFVVISYHWLVAFSLHEQLCLVERTGPVYHATTAAPCNWHSIRTNVHDVSTGHSLRTVTIDMSSVPHSVEKAAEAAGEKPVDEDVDKEGDKAGDQVVDTADSPVTCPV